MKKIPLTQSKSAIVNDRFYKRLMEMGSWQHNDGYAQKRQNGRTVQMHRIIWQLAGRKLPRQLDHRDTNGLNNQLSNLRPATPSQNAQNRGPSRSNISGYKGVHYLPLCNKYCAKIQVRGKHKNLGHFKKAKQAAKAYDKAATRYFGEFAWLNFPTMAV
jgi:hypothetical protein